MRGDGTSEEPPFHKRAQAPEALHTVQFHGQGDFPADSVALFLAESILSREAILIIAVPQHVRMLMDELADLGLSLESLQARGQLVVLEARDTLTRICENGIPDRERFDSLIGEAVAAQAKQFGSVRAFGEMVSLLWESGGKEGAFLLEELWNELCERFPISLLCTYLHDDPAHPCSDRDRAKIRAFHDPQAKSD
jgi:hypothetical protein